MEETVMLCFMTTVYCEFVRVHAQNVHKLPYLSLPLITPSNIYPGSHITTLHVAVWVVHTIKSIFTLS